eukprot:Nk52_evm40s152 gene=Nk52_evmTU40s152
MNGAFEKLDRLYASNVNINQQETKEGGGKGKIGDEHNGAMNEDNLIWVPIPAKPSDFHDGLDCMIQKHMKRTARTSRKGLFQEPPKPGKAFEVNNRQITVVKFRDKFYAFERWCPHQKGDLVNADIEEGSGQVSDTVAAYTNSQEYRNMVENNDVDKLEVSFEIGNLQTSQVLLSCPIHHWKFSLTFDGESLNPRCGRLPCYKVRVKGDLIEVGFTELEKSWFTSTEF